MKHFVTRLPRGTGGPRPDAGTGFAERDRGQALVEMALMAVIILILLSFLLDIARSYYSFQVLKDAAGEGAYYGSVHPTWIDDDDPCPDPASIAHRVKHAAPSGGLVDLQDADVDVEAPSTTAGSLITVTVTVDFHLVAPFTPALVGSQTLPLTATSSARILSPATACPSS